jgi:hypothetical protein
MEKKPPPLISGPIFDTGNRAVKRASVGVMSAYGLLTVVAPEFAAKHAGLIGLILGLFG